MPLYEFSCDSCGNFEAWRTLAEIDKPMPCPQCEATTKRVFSPPMVNLNSSSFSSIGRKESKEPKLVKREKEPLSPKYHSTRSGRPWMIGHTTPRTP